MMTPVRIVIPTTGSAGVRSVPADAAGFQDLRLGRSGGIAGAGRHPQNGAGDHTQHDKFAAVFYDSKDSSRPT